jgi:hypothetical protein
LVPIEKADAALTFGSCPIFALLIILEDPAIGRKRRLPGQLFMSLWYDFKYLSPRKKEDLIMRRMIVVAPSHQLEIKTSGGAKC